MGVLDELVAVTVAGHHDHVDALGGGLDGERGDDVVGLDPGTARRIGIASASSTSWISGICREDVGGPMRLALYSDRPWRNVGSGAVEDHRDRGRGAGRAAA